MTIGNDVPHPKAPHPVRDTGLMPRDNVEAVLGVFDAFVRRDERGMFAVYDEDVEWSLERYSVWLDTPVCRGHEGIRTFFRAWLLDFEDYETKALDPLDLGDKVVITVYDRAHGKTSGVPIERYHSQVWTFREGRVIRVEVFDDRPSAEAAACAAQEGVRSTGF